MHVVLPLTKGHLSNKGRIFWQKGCPYYKGATVTPYFVVTRVHCTYLCIHCEVILEGTVSSGILYNMLWNFQQQL